MQGRHPLQTSDALGAAAAQLGPDAQAAVVELNKQGGMSHGKISHILHSLFGIRLTSPGPIIFSGRTSASNSSMVCAALRGRISSS